MTLLGPGLSLCRILFSTMGMRWHLLATSLIFQLLLLSRVLTLMLSLVRPVVYVLAPHMVKRLVLLMMIVLWLRDSPLRLDGVTPLSVMWLDPLTLIAIAPVPRFR